MKKHGITGTRRRYTAIIGLFMILMISAGAAAQPAPAPQQPEPAPQQPEPAPQQPEPAPQQPAPAPAPPQPAPPEQPQVPQPQQQISPVSDEELRQFAEAVANVQEIQVETQEEIESVIEDSGLSRERFVEIFESTQTQGAEDIGEVTEAEQEQFDAIVEAITALQMSSQDSMREAVTESGLDLQRFNDILAAVQTDPTLMQRLQPHLEENGVN